MTERDRDLEKALGELPVPDHAPDFWDRLDAQLARRTGAAGSGGRPDVDPRRDGAGGVDGAAGGDDPDLALDDEPAVVLPLRRPRVGRPGDHRWAPPAGPRRWLAVAAAALVAVVGGVALLGTLDDRADVVTVAGEGAGGQSAGDGGTDGGSGVPGPVAVDPSRVASVEPLGPGLVVGALPAADGTATILVRGRLPGGEVGCEGAPLEGLLVLEPDGSTTPVRSAAGSVIPDGADVHPAPRGDGVAVISRCEGYLSQLLVGRVGPDGVPTDLVLVAGHGAGQDTPVADAPPLEQARSLAWSADGSRLWVVGGGPGEDGGAAVWHYTPSTGRWSEPADAAAGAVAVVERIDGSRVTLTGNSLAVDGQARPSGSALGLALAPDGRTVVAFGPEGLMVVTADGEQRILDVGPVTDARFLPDGSTLVVAQLSGDEGRTTRLATIQGAVDGGRAIAPAELGASAWGWFRVLPGGRGLAVTVDGEAGVGGFADPAVEIWQFASS